MKLEFRGHSEKYVVEQSLMTLFPGELPVYEPIDVTQDQTWAIISLVVYVGIPFCPTRCVYCSFVSQSVEKSFSMVPPYVEALVKEIESGGEMVRREGLRVRAFYMGGGTPTTLTAQQMDTVLSALERSFDLSACEELTVEAGRPDTIRFY